MKSIKISLEMAQKVKEFVNVTQNYPNEILLKSGKYVVDAKSILGIFSLDLSQPLTVEVYGEDTDGLLDALKKFEA
ncbi:MAG: HPr family phosphocarrier protein [Clostridia bacterium]|nr:HPr family phosphocarrier protein [Clostridia bacterium]